MSHIEKTYKFNSSLTAKFKKNFNDQQTIKHKRNDSYNKLMLSMNSLDHLENVFLYN